MTELKRRVVGGISNYLQPKEIFNLIMARTRTYHVTPDLYISRDRALCAFCFVTAGRISPIVGDYKLKRKEGQAMKVGKYDGLCWHNLTITQDYILTSKLQTGKRTEKIIKKYGQQSAIREDFVVPLRKGIYEDRPAFDQLIPFGWLILEYLVNFAISTDQQEIFPMSRTWAWKIVDEVTGQFPHWFRAQGEHFYGNYVFKGDTIMLAKFMKIIRPEQLAHYIRFDWRAGLNIDSEWITPETEKIKNRIEPQKLADLLQLKSEVHTV
jgi:hypothetical protein